MITIKATDWNSGDIFTLMFNSTNKLTNWAKRHRHYITYEPMTTLNPKTYLEIYKVEEKENHYLVDYSLGDDNGTANMTKYPIRKRDLVKFIEDAGLNMVEAWNFRLGDMEYDYLHPETYLYENADDVIKRYLTENLK